MDTSEKEQLIACVKEGKPMAIVAYLTPIGWIIALFINKDPKNQFSGFHIRQALGIHLLYFLLVFLVSGFNSWSITIGFWVFSFVLWAYGFTGALSGKYNSIPILGPYFQKWFSKFVE